MNSVFSLAGLGVHVPERVLTNSDLEKLMDTTDEWIVSRTGISSRHIIHDSEDTSDIGFYAAQNALLDAGVEAHELTHIIVATCTPSHLTPSVSCLIAGKLGLSHSSSENNKEKTSKSLMCFDFNAACSGFVYGLEIAKAFLTTNKEATILLVCAEAMSRRMNYQDRSTSILFGDGAGAVVLRAKGKSFLQIKDVSCDSDGSLASLIEIGGATKDIKKMGDCIGEDYFLQMQGQEVYKHAVRTMSQEVLNLLDRNNITIDDIDLFIPHQANMRIIEAVGARIKINPDKVFSNLKDYGNTSAASIPLALADARKLGLVQKDKTILVVTFGAGLTWAAALFTSFESE